MINYGKLGLLFFSPLFSIYSYAICMYPEMRAVFWILGGAYGRSSNLHWVLPPTLLCTCRCHRTHAHAHAHVHTCTHTLSYTYTHSCMFVQTFLSWLSLPTTGISNRNDWYTQFYTIPVPSGGHWYGQPTRKGLHEHAYIYLHITGARHAHWGVMYATHCIPWLHFLCTL